MIKQLIMLLLICAVQVFSNSVDNTKIVHLSILFRHGNRIPLYGFPNDPLGPAYWSKYGSLGDITPKGIKVVYDLGVAVRKQYNFLNKTYSSDRVRVRSTDLDRALVSAQAMMAGLYSPSKQQKWNNRLNWYPIPVHTEAFATDRLYTYSIPCPLYASLLEENRKSIEHLEFTQANQAYYTNASLLSGLNSTGLQNGLNEMMNQLVDALISELVNGASIPQWAQENFSKYKELFDFSVYTVVRTPRLARFFAGSQLNEIRNNLIGKANGSLSYELSVYSTHDTMLAGFIQLLNMSVPRVQPPFGSALIFELRKDEAQKYYVRVMAKLNNPDEPIRFQEVTIYECEEILCPLEKFVKLTSNKVISDYSKECQLN